MQYLYDETGRRYLDMFAGIVTVSVGHSYPESGGLDGNTLRIKRPMCITADDVDCALYVLDQAFSTVGSK